MGATTRLRVPPGLAQRAGTFLQLFAPLNLTVSVLSSKPLLLFSLFLPRNLYCFYSKLATYIKWPLKKNHKKKLNFNSASWHNNIVCEFCLDSQCQEILKRPRCLWPLSHQIKSVDCNLCHCTQPASVNTMAFCHNLLSQFATPCSIRMHFWLNKAGEIWGRWHFWNKEIAWRLKFPGQGDSKCEGLINSSKQTETKHHNEQEGRCMCTRPCLHLTS